MFKIGDFVRIKPTDEIVEMFKDDGPEWIKSSTYQRLKNKKLVVKSFSPNVRNLFGIEVLDQETGFCTKLNMGLFELSFNEIKEEELIGLFTGGKHAV